MADRRSGSLRPRAIPGTVPSLRWVLVGATFLVVLALVFIRWMDFWLGA